MDWIEIAVKTTTEGIDPVSGILIMNGITGYAVEDKCDFEEFLRDKEVYWDYIEDSLMKLRECDTTVTFYVTNDAEGIEQLSLIKSELSRLLKEDTDKKFGELSAEVKNIAEEDWANNWKKFFKPLNIGERLVVKPTWENLDDANGRTIVEIDPSSSFGTGSHTTTKLCLEYIEKIDSLLGEKNYEMIDVGCGSGILGIAAHKLSGAHVTAIDIEENSIRVAKENFETNAVDENAYDLFIGSITDDEELWKKVSSVKYKMLAANIVADVLKAMAPYFNEILADDGYAVISGIIAERADEVEQAFLNTGFGVKEKNTKDGWTAILLVREKR
ncbi:MAG: 50S ribosomal protein L11 methyltransferase [Ruminococcaceae bacterium]|nr:50S ribosomal protein L11 methyltransferase [Oscillospiraceae bacterium]